MPPKHPRMYRSAPPAWWKELESNQHLQGFNLALVPHELPFPMADGQGIEPCRRSGLEPDPLTQSAIQMADREGVEPPARGLTARCSDH